jgi:hypothetical protein
MFYSSQSHRWRYPPLTFFCRNSNFGIFSSTVFRRLRQRVWSRTFNTDSCRSTSKSSEAPMSLKASFNGRHHSFLHFVQRFLYYRISVDFVHWSSRMPCVSVVGAFCLLYWQPPHGLCRRQLWCTRRFLGALA